MAPDILLVAWKQIFWYFLSIVIFGVAILLTVIILVQDSKETGLTSAFGGTGGGALLGARMQKDLAKLTAILGIILAVCLLIMGYVTSAILEEGSAAEGMAPAVSDEGAGAKGVDTTGSETPSASSESSTSPGQPVTEAPVLPPKEDENPETGAAKEEASKEEPPASPGDAPGKAAPGAGSDSGAPKPDTSKSPDEEQGSIGEAAPESPEPAGQ